jgi:hypothetical protein
MGAFLRAFVNALRCLPKDRLKDLGSLLEDAYNIYAYLLDENCAEKYMEIHAQLLPVDNFEMLKKVISELCARCSLVSVYDTSIGIGSSAGAACGGAGIGAGAACGGSNGGAGAACGGAGIGVGSSSVSGINNEFYVACLGFLNIVETVPRFIDQPDGTKFDMENDSMLGLQMFGLIEIVKKSKRVYTIHSVTGKLNAAISNKSMKSKIVFLVTLVNAIYNAEAKATH